MTPEQLSDQIIAVLTKLVSTAKITLDEIPASVVIERPRNPEHGDYASNVAMQLAKKAGLPPRDFAGLVAAELASQAGITKVDIAGPGFLNISVSVAAQSEIINTIMADAAKFGLSQTLAGQKINVEFISANPTGPLHLGHTRWAVVGDALARVLQAAGAEVTREFYINDRGAQMDKFGASIVAAATGDPVPEDGYHGAYVADLAQQVLAARPDLLTLNAADQVMVARDVGYQIQLTEQQQQLAEFNTNFDVWFSEASLHQDDSVNQSLGNLKSLGHLYEKDGALWMQTTDFADDKDRVLRRSNGELTYFASDTAYYLSKRARGFDRCIYLLGADHHGYIGRLQAMAACVGDDPDQNIEILIGQLVKIFADGKEVKLSKRAGTIVTLAELMEMIGVDALRYTLARYPCDSPLTLDVAEMTRKASDNPVFYVQYAHARLASIARNAADLGVAELTADLALLADDKEGDLLRTLAEFPAIIAGAAQLREPHRVARYLEETAASFHKFYDHCRVLPQGDEVATQLHAARLQLVQATRQVLANGLALLGVSAPDRM